MYYPDWTLINNNQNATHVTLIPNQFRKQRYGGAIYKVLSALDQSFFHKLVAINYHNPPTKEGEDENIYIFLCKLSKDGRSVLGLITELTTF